MRTTYAVALLLAIGSAAAEAATNTYCVANTQELTAALNDASQKAIANGDDTVIRLRQSTVEYQAYFPRVVGVTEFHSLIMLGGYTDSECTSSGRKLDARNTKLRPMDHVQVAGNFLLEGTTSASWDIGDTSGGQQANIEFRGNLLHVNETDDGAGISINKSVNGGHGETIFVGNVIVGEKQDDGSFHCSVSVSHNYAGGPATFVNNTFLDASTSAVCLYVVPQAHFYNNVFWNHGGMGVHDEGPALGKPAVYTIFNQNILHGPLPPDHSSQGTLTLTPVFADPSQGDYTLVGPAGINASWDGAESYLDRLTDEAGNPIDLYGNPRKIGSLPDMGAVESTIDDSDVLMVSNNEDSGAGSLRDALVSANATNSEKVQIIRFDFEDSDADQDNCDEDSTIILDSPLPPITDRVYIDGYFAKGSKRNWAAVGFDGTPCVRLLPNPFAVSPPTNGLEVSTQAPEGTKLTVKGLQFNGFTGAGIALNGGDYHTIQGNVFGAETSVTTAGNGRGVFVGQGVTGAVIGGNEPPDRNWIVKSSMEGIVLGGTLGNAIGNLVGLDQSGKLSASAQNLRGIQITGDDNYVKANTVSGNASDAITIASGADRNIVYRNNLGYVDGLTCTGFCSPGAANRRGVFVLGNDNKISENDIGFNQQQGIAVGGGAVGNSLRFNRISQNGGLGIELAGGDTHTLDGLPSLPQLADVEEPTALGQINGNHGMNFPVMAFAVGLPKPADEMATGTVSGTLTSRNGSYEIQIYVNATCLEEQGVGEGARLIGVGSVKIENEQPDPVDGTGTFAIGVSSKTALIGRHITAIAVKTDDPRKGSTSEFSQCLQFTEVQPVPDNEPPVFAAQTFPLLESSPAGAQITLQASDDFKPNPPGVLEFSMQDQTVPFSLDGPTGVLTQVGEDIFKDTDQYQFDVTVTDGQDSVTATITIQKQLEGIFEDGFEDPQP